MSPEQHKLSSAGSRYLCSSSPRWSDRSSGSTSNMSSSSSLRLDPIRNRGFNHLRGTAELHSDAPTDSVWKTLQSNERKTRKKGQKIPAETEKPTEIILHVFGVFSIFMMAFTLRQKINWLHKIYRDSKSPERRRGNSFEILEA